MSSHVSRVKVDIELLVLLMGAEQLPVSCTPLPACGMTLDRSLLKQDVRGTIEGALLFF